MTKDVLVSVRGIHTAEADGENGNVEVIKNGLAKTHMVFEEHKTNVSYYATSFGKMMVGVSTNTIEIEGKPDRIAVAVDYTPDINDEKMSSCIFFVLLAGKQAFFSFLKVESLTSSYDVFSPYFAFQQFINLIFHKFFMPVIQQFIFVHNQREDVRTSV